MTDSLAPTSDAPPPPSPTAPDPAGEATVALAGNPNVGKTTLFNALTGLRQKVANYPGVTVEKKSGRCTLSEKLECQIIDLPGTYSLASRSPDEHVARQVVLGQIPGTPRPDVIVVVADASNLERNLYLVTQVLELGRPVVVALSMVDVAAKQGKTLDVDKLSRHLRAPVVPVQAHKGKDEEGVIALRSAIARALRHARPATGSDVHALDLPLPQVMETHIERLKRILSQEGLSSPDQAYFDAHLMLSLGDEEAQGGDLPDPRRAHPKVRQEIAEALRACAAADIDPVGAEVETHYAFISGVIADSVREAPVEGAPAGGRLTRTDRIDRIVTHKIWGMVTFIGLMALMFLAIFSWAAPVMEFLSETLVNEWIGGAIGSHMAQGPLKDLMLKGIVAGVGNVVVFLPQIALLFLFLAILEDSGYMSRAAFLMDRLMSRVGLHGKSFIPLLSGYACAIPAIMGTRVIENRRDRLATILILPLMSCSARLPGYALVIAAFFGAYSGMVQAGILLSMYLLGTFSAFGMAWVFKRTLLKGPAPAFILEMPPYLLPHWKVVLTTVAQRCGSFLKRAGTVIFAMSVVMWAATSYPRPAAYSRDYEEQIAQLEEQVASLEAVTTPATAIEEHASRISDLRNAQARETLENSAAGRVGRFIAPVFKPLGFDWKLSIGVTGAFFAREIVVSTLGIVYSVGEADETSASLQESFRNDYTPLVGISLMVFIVFCMQCLPTLAVTRRETGHWGWPLFMFAYMTALAWIAALVTFQGGSLLASMVR